MKKNEKTIIEVVHASKEDLGKCFQSHAQKSQTSALLAFGIGGVANVAAKGISDKILNSKASFFANMGNKAKSLAVQKLQGMKHQETYSLI